MPGVGPTGAFLAICAGTHWAGGWVVEVFAYELTEEAAGCRVPVTQEAWQAAGDDDKARARRIARLTLDAPGGLAVRRALLGDERKQRVAGIGSVLDELAAECVLELEED